MPYRRKKLTFAISSSDEFLSSKNGTVALRSTLERISEHAHYNVANVRQKSHKNCQVPTTAVYQIFEFRRPLHAPIPGSRPAPSDFTAFPVSTFCAGETYNGVGRDTVERECIDKPVLSNGTNKLFLFQRDNGEVVRMSNKNAQFLPHPTPAQRRRANMEPHQTWHDERKSIPLLHVSNLFASDLYAVLLLEGADNLEGNTTPNFKPQ